MKNVLFYSIFLLSIFQVIAQESIKLNTVYFVNKCYGTNCLIVETSAKEKILDSGKTVELAYKSTVNGVEASFTKQHKLTEDLKVNVTKTSTPENWKTNRSAVMFKDDKLYVNRYLRFNKKGKDEGRNDTYYFRLDNRETISLRHRGVYLSALTIPIKYRPPLTDKEGNEIGEEFVTDFNANLFLSTTIWGKTNFTYLKNNENSIRDHNVRLGALIGGSTLKLNPKNTANAPEGRALAEGQEITKGLFSFGLGITYTYNEFGVGAFLGWDQAVGSGSNIWDYDGAPWLGISFGIDILKIGRITQ